jgi:hypothetical protein
VIAVYFLLSEPHGCVRLECRGTFTFVSVAGSLLFRYWHSTESTSYPSPCCVLHDDSVSVSTGRASSTLLDSPSFTVKLNTMILDLAIGPHFDKAALKARWRVGKSSFNVHCWVAFPTGHLYIALYLIRLDFSYLRKWPVSVSRAENGL